MALRDTCSELPRGGRLRALCSWRHVVFAVTLAVYVTLTIAVVVGSPLDRLDQSIAQLDLHARWPGWNRFVLDYVMLGQRAPSTLVALPWILWQARRQRSLRPVVLTVTALFLLNLSVGIVKIATGRYGPLVTQHAHEVLAGGNIFPSGHTANAVVLYGVMAMMTVKHRRAMAALAIWISLTVGLSTLFLDTHWLTDVVGGWLAGGLVLMVLPRCLPIAERGVHRVLTAAAALWRTVSGRRVRAPRLRELPPAVRRVAVTPQAVGVAPQPVRVTPRPAASPRPVRVPAERESV
jgi:undecaprenyl-diphosphatase